MKLLYNARYTLSISVFFVVFFFFSTQLVLGKIGVGMGAGEIHITEPIKPGGIYTLPNLRVFNTGDETTTYGMNIAYHQDHLELRPQKNWFTFNPTTFTVEPGQSQEIEITMMVPLKTVPGDYFTFVESGPVASNEAGTSVGVAVATKLYFTVVYANLWDAFTNRIADFMVTYTPWSWIVLGIVLLSSIGFIFVRFFSFNISFRKKEPTE